MASVIPKAQHPQVIQPDLLRDSAVWLWGLFIGAENVAMYY